MTSSTILHHELGLSEQWQGKSRTRRSNLLLVFLPRSYWLYISSWISCRQVVTLSVAIFWFIKRWLRWLAKSLHWKKNQSARVGRPLLEAMWSNVFFSIPDTWFSHSLRGFSQNQGAHGLWIQPWSCYLFVNSLLFYWSITHMMTLIHCLYLFLLKEQRARLFISYRQPSNHLKKATTHPSRLLQDRQPWWHGV